MDGVAVAGGKMSEIIGEVDGKAAEESGKARQAKRNQRRNTPDPTHAYAWSGPIRGQR